MSGPFHLQWHAPAFEGDDRHILTCGALHVGAAFAGANYPSGRRRGVRWRVWVTKNMNPVDGVSASLEAAKEACEARVREALSLMLMVPA